MEHPRLCQFIEAALDRQQVALAVHGPCPDLHRTRRLERFDGLFDRLVELLSTSTVGHCHLSRSPMRSVAISPRAMIADIPHFAAMGNALAGGAGVNRAVMAYARTDGERQPLRSSRSLVRLHLAHERPHMRPV